MKTIFEMINKVSDFKDGDYQFVNKAKNREFIQNLLEAVF
jgi:hypothetical protein